MNEENHNKPSAEEVIDSIFDEQTNVKSEVVNSGINESLVVDSMLEDTAPKEETVSNDESPETTTDDNTQPEETTTEETPAVETKDEVEETKTEEIEEEEKPEEKSNEEVKDDQDELFASIGSMKFKTKDELVKYTNSQVGYNSWLTGKLKRIRPDLFDNDGKIKTSEIEKAIADATNKVQDATETINRLEEKDKLTDDDKAEIEKARSILKPLGVVFSDDPDYQTMKNKAERFDTQEVDHAKQYIADFEAKNPEFVDHKLGVAELMEKTGYDLPTAWKAYSAANGISQPPLQRDAQPKNKPTESVIPKVVNRQSGSMPASGNKDFMDDLLNTPMM
jgi:hypothetical protein